MGRWEHRKDGELCSCGSMRNKRGQCHARRRDEKAKARRRRAAPVRQRAAYPPKPLGCEVCGRVTGTLVRDHDHSCHETLHACCFRGWLCRQCNLILGCAQDDPVLLRALADFLEK